MFLNIQRMHLLAFSLMCVHIIFIEFKNLYKASKMSVKVLRTMFSSRRLCRILCSAKLRWHLHIGATRPRPAGSGTARTLCQSLSWSSKVSGQIRGRGMQYTNFIKLVFINYSNKQCVIIIRLSSSVQGQLADEAVGGPEPAAVVVPGAVRRVQVQVRVHAADTTLAPPGAADIIPCILDIIYNSIHTI